MEQVFSLADETAPIAGGGTGIGLGIARCMVAAVARVGLVGRRESELSNASVEQGRMGQPEDVGWAAIGF